MPHQLILMTPLPPLVSGQLPLGYTLVVPFARVLSCVPGHAHNHCTVLFQDRHSKPPQYWKLVGVALMLVVLRLRFCTTTLAASPLVLLVLLVLVLLVLVLVLLVLVLVLMLVLMLILTLGKAYRISQRVCDERMCCLQGAIHQPKKALQHHQKRRVGGTEAGNSHGLHMWDTNTDRWTRWYSREAATWMCGTRTGRPEKKVTTSVTLCTHFVHVLAHPLGRHPRKKWSPFPNVCAESEGVFGKQKTAGPPVSLLQLSWPLRLLPVRVVPVLLSTLTVVLVLALALVLALVLGPVRGPLP